MNLIVEDKQINITNPDKYLWPKLEIRKIDYLTKLLELAPYLLPHAKNRLLTTIRYPDGAQNKSFFQKNVPSYAPKWIPNRAWHDNHYILLDNLATLAWLGNQASLEFHIPFNLCHQETFPTDLVFDLDPSEGQTFDDVTEIALLLFQELNALNIKSFAKTSGASGLQIYIPVGGKYDYETARKLNHFFAVYFSQKFSQKITLERSIAKRGKKLYFDYLQMWQGKTIICPYSPRATDHATVATPVEWDEIKKGIKPQDFNLLNITERLKVKKDLFSSLLDGGELQDLSFVLQHINPSSESALH